MSQRLSRSLRLAAVTLLVLACTACGALFGPPKPTAEEFQQQVIDIVHEADPAATNVEVEIVTSGLSQGYLVRIDHEGEVGPDLLESILRPIAASDLQPVDIRLYFVEPGTDNPVDIRTAADELGFLWAPWGAGAIWLSGDIEG